MILLSSFLLRARREKSTPAVMAFWEVLCHKGPGCCCCCCCFYPEASHNLAWTTTRTAAILLKRPRLSVRNVTGVSFPSAAAEAAKTGCALCTLVEKVCRRRRENKIKGNPSLRSRLFLRSRPRSQKRLDGFHRTNENASLIIAAAAAAAVMMQIFVPVTV